MAVHARQRGNGTWEPRPYLGRDPLTGRKRYATKTRRGEGQRAADKALATFVAGLGAGGVSRPSASVSFEELVERWLEKAGPGWSPSNDVTVRRIVGSYLAPLMTVRIDRLRPADLDAFYAGLRQRGARAVVPCRWRRFGGCTTWPLGVPSGHPMGVAGRQPGVQGIPRVGSGDRALPPRRRGGGCPAGAGRAGQPGVRPVPRSGGGDRRPPGRAAGAALARRRPGRRQPRLPT